jgi:sugar lactone lactonase YvrE
VARSAAISVGTFPPTGHAERTVSGEIIVIFCFATNFGYFGRSSTVQHYAQMFGQRSASAEGVVMRLRFQACLLLLSFLLAGTGSARAERIYVALETSNQIVSYDVSLSGSAAVQSSMQVFTSTNLSQPYGLAFDSSGNLYAANNGSSTVSKYNVSGGFLGTIGSPSTISQPQGLAFDASGNLYVSNNGDNTISTFSSAGSFLTSIGSSSNLDGPNGLAIDASGNLYVANTNNDTIATFNNTGAFVSAITAGVSGPYDLAYASGFLYAAQSYDTVVTKYDSSGNLAASIGGGSSLSSPLGVAIDSIGNVYASTSEQIFKFDSSGVFQFAWSTPVGAYSTYLAIAPSSPDPASVPEIDPSGLGSMLALVAGLGGLLERRRRS